MSNSKALGAPKWPNIRFNAVTVVPSPGAKGKLFCLFIRLL